MRVRNFYLDAKIDGRKSRLTGGPVRKDGGLRLTIKQRDKGGITTALTIEANADLLAPARANLAGKANPGELELRVYDGTGELIHRGRTVR